MKIVTVVMHAPKELKINKLEDDPFIRYHTMDFESKIIISVTPVDFCRTPLPPYLKSVDLETKLGGGNSCSGIITMTNDEWDKLIEKANKLGVLKPMKSY